MFFAWRKGMSLNEFLMGFLRSYMGVSWSPPSWQARSSWGAPGAATSAP